MKHIKITLIFFSILLCSVKMQAQDYDVKTEKMVSAWVNVPAMPTVTTETIPVTTAPIAHKTIVRTRNVKTPKVTVIQPAALPKASPPKKLSEKDVLKKLKIDE